MESTPNMTGMDYLLAVSEVSCLKSMFGEEDDLIKEQKEEYRIKKEERITKNIRSILSSFPQVLDHQEKPILDLVVPRGKRSVPNARPRKVTEQFLCDVGESMIKKAVENNSEQQEENRAIKDFDNEENRGINWGGVANFVVRNNNPIGVSNQEFLENRGKAADHRENRMFKINCRGSANFVSLPIKKRSREVANNGPLGFNNQERFLNKKMMKKEASRKKKKVKRNTVAGVEAPPVVIINRELNVAFKNRIVIFGGSLESVKLVIEKRLYKSDVDKGEGRLSIPIRQVRSEFLEQEEVALLNTRNEKRMCEMKVMLIEPSLERSEINLRKWFKDNGNTSLSYVLLTYWNEVRERNGLKIGNKVKLWAFRKGPDLCFALVKLHD